MAEAYLALGSNLGDRRQHLRNAVRALADHGVRTLQTSSLYESAPMYVLDQPAFLNAVIRVETLLSSDELLGLAKRLEHELGRQPRQRNGPREIDIDLLTYDQERRTTEALTLPHPRIGERPFVMAPLSELRGERVQLVDGLSIVEAADWVNASVGHSHA